jgi:hypothetical protein
MRCGSKCFIVEIEVQGEKHTKSVTARKTIRGSYGTETHILSVIEDKKKNL